MAGLKFLRGNIGDDEIYFGFGTGADLSFLEDYYSVFGTPELSDDDGLYWGLYYKKGYYPDVPDDDDRPGCPYDCEPEWLADNTVAYMAMPHGAYEFENWVVDDNSEPGYTEVGFSTLPIEDDPEDYEDRPMWNMPGPK